MVASETPMRERILAAARTELTLVGPAALSMRAVAREVGVTVGALYRYFKNRDELLTELIVEAYESLGEAVDAGIAQVWEANGEARGTSGWVAAGLAARRWGTARPHEFLLLYGTPVIGYDAPQRTIGSASRVIVALVGIVVAAREAGFALPAGTYAVDTSDAALAEDFARIRAWLVEMGFAAAAPRVAVEDIFLTIRSWTELLGTISFEIAGHYRNSVESGRPYLEQVLRAQARALGLP